MLRLLESTPPLVERHSDEHHPPECPEQLRDETERAEGDEARIEFRASGDTVETPNGIFVEAVEEVEEETPTPTPEETPEPDTPEDTPEPEPDTPEEETPEPDDQAGFGAVIALIALLGAALLAARRNALN